MFLALPDWLLPGRGDANVWRVHRSLPGVLPALRPRLRELPRVDPARPKVQHCRHGAANGRHRNPEDGDA